MNHLEIDRNRRVVYDLSQGAYRKKREMHTSYELWQAALQDHVLAPMNHLEIDRNRRVVYDLSQGAYRKKREMHTSYELWQAALQDHVLAPIMSGVYPSDKVRIINIFPFCLIANTDPHDLPGTH